MPAADPGMKEKLLAERDGILAWPVRGCREWRRAGEVGNPDAVRAATEESRAGESTAGPASRADGRSRPRQKD